MKQFSVLFSFGAALLALAAWTAYSHRVELATVDYQPSDMERLERFHGHLGPYIVLGARMGEYAVLERDFPAYFGVFVEVECPDEPPVSCLIDGLQLSTGATLGKRNIEHTPADEVRVTITDDLHHKQLTFSFKPETVALLKQWEADGVSVEERGRIVFDMTAEELFDIED